MAKLTDTAKRILHLHQQGRDVEAREVAGTLLNPQRVAQLNSRPSQQMSPSETQAMDLARARCVNLLETLIAGGLLDAREVPGQLRAPDRGGVFERIARNARALTGAPPAAKEPSADLEAAVRALEQVDVEGAYRADVRAPAPLTLHSVVAGEVAMQWGRAVAQAFRDPSPQGLLQGGAPVETATYDRALRSWLGPASTLGDDLAGRASKALMSSPASEAVLSDLAGTGPSYRPEKHRDFNEQMCVQVGAEIDQRLQNVMKVLQSQALDEFKVDDARTNAEGVARLNAALAKLEL